jgi:rhodanese-related sulfurtransferase
LRSSPYVWDDKKKAFPWSLNPDFVKLVKERFSSEGTILVTCRSGGRGAMAINMLAAAGFMNACNILDGMGGSRVDDPYCVFKGMRRGGDAHMAQPPRARGPRRLRRVRHHCHPPVGDDPLAWSGEA